MRHNFSMLFFVAVAFLLSSCAKTEVAGVWRDDSSAVEIINKIMVIGLFKDNQIQINVENQLVKEINEHGGKAFPSYKVFPLESINDKELVAGKLKATGAEHILIVRVKDRHQIDSYIPGEIYDAPPKYYYDFYDFAKKVHGEIIRVGYLSPMARRSNTAKREQFTTETNLYSSQSEKLIITIASDSKFLYRNSRIIEGLSKTVIEKLAKNNLIAD